MEFLTEWARTDAKPTGGVRMTWPVVDMSLRYSEIPRDRWRLFCDHFTGQHRGWRVTVAVADSTEVEGGQRHCGA